MIAHQFRYFGPVALISLCLVALCAFTAASLLGQQKVITKVFRENVESRRVAVEIEECLTDLIALENDRVEKVTVLHDRLQVLLQGVTSVADQPEEKRLLTQLELAFRDYMESWRALPPLGQSGHDDARGKATRLLQTTVLEPCQELKQFNARRIEESAEEHEHVLGRLAWGLAAVGGLGAVAGAVLGYGVANGLARSIRRLRIQIRDAVGKLNPGPSEIVLTGQGDFNGLHDELDQLTGRIEAIIGNLRQREQEILRAEQLAAVGQLAAGVAHEIRNPLTSIMLLVQAGLEDTQGLASDDLQVIESEVRRMERSLQTFLDFARPPKPQRKPTSLAPLLQGVVGLIRGRADQQRVRIELTLPHTELTAIIDPDQFRQVMVNLGLNALDAMPTGGVLTITLTQPRDGIIEIEMLDTGTGITESILPQLFQPFVSSKDSGLGLGLVISRRILEDHGGGIEAENRPQGGARMLVAFPANPTNSIGMKVV